MAVHVGVRAELLDEVNLDGDGALGVAGDDFQALGTEADLDLSAVLSGHRGAGGLGDGHACGAELGPLAVDREGAQVHGGGADEACDELVGGTLVHLLRGAALLEEAAGEDRDAVAHRQSLGLVVGDVHGGDAELTLQGGDLRTGLDAQLRIQVRQGLVHEEHLGLTDDRAAHGDALTLATGQGLGLAVQVGLQVEDLSGLFDALVDLFLGGAGDLQGEAHVLAHRHVGVEGVVLEDHRDVAVLRRNVRDVLVADEDATGVDVLQAREHAQRGGLTAAGRADEDEELAVLDFEVELVDGGLVGTRVDAGRLVKSDGCHGVFLPTGRYVPDDP